MLSPRDIGLIELLRDLGRSALMRGDSDGAWWAFGFATDIAMGRATDEQYRKLREAVEAETARRKSDRSGT